MPGTHRSLAVSFTVPTSIGIVLGFLALAVAPSRGAGQGFLPDPVDQTTLWFSWEKPFIPNAGSLSAFSSIVGSSVVGPWRPGVSFRLGTSLALADDAGDDGPSAFLGNVHASLISGEPGLPRSFIGVVLPTATSFGGSGVAQAVWTYSALDELEAMTADGFAIRGAVMPSRPTAGGGRVGLRLGGVVLGHDGLKDAVFYARVAGWGRFPLAGVELRANLSTQYLINQDWDLGDRFTAYLDLGVSPPDSSGSPALFIRLPLDSDARDLLDLSVGLRVGLR